MLDLLIRGGEVVTPQGVIRCDVAIAGETIAAIAAMVSPATATSHLMTPCGVTASPPRMRRSSINPPGHCGG